MFRPLIKSLTSLWVLLLLFRGTIAQDVDTMLRYQVSLTGKPGTYWNAGIKTGVSDKNDRFFLVTTDEQFAEYAVFDRDFKLVASNKTMPIRRNNELYKESFVGWAGTIMKPNSANFINGSVTGTGNKQKKKVWNEKVNMDGSVEYKQLFEIPVEETILNYIVKDDKIYVLCTSDYKEEIVIYVSNTEGVSERKTIPVQLKQYFPTKLSFYEYFRPAAHILPKTEQSFQDAARPVKLIVDSNKLTLLIVTPGETLHIWDIDLLSFQIGFRKLDLTGFSGHGTNTRFFLNATVYDKKIFLENLTRNGLEIAIFELNTLKLIKKFEIKEDAKFYFSELPRIIEYGSGITRGGLISSNSKLFAMITEGTPMIKVGKNEDGNLLVTAGSFSERYVQTSYSSYKITRLVKFKIILDSTSLDQIEELYTRPPETSDDLIVDELRKPFTHFRPFTWHGKKYFSYLSVADNSFRIQTTNIK